MYIPQYATVPDQELLKRFVQEHSFGTLITQDLNANHYPFLLSEENDNLILYTHLARSNPQWKEIDNANCLAIFTGPHAYISPVYYVNPMNVPTWSYTAVHAKCTASIVLNSHERLELMKKLVTHFEMQNKTNWDYNLPQDFHDDLMNTIVWIRLKVNHLDGKFKLSQNREKQDYQSLRSALEKDTSDNMKKLLQLMDLTGPYK